MEGVIVIMAEQPNSSEKPTFPVETASHEPARHDLSSIRPDRPPPDPAGALVGIIKTHEKHRSIERVTALVKDAVGLIGGMARFIKPGQTVLIKPNQTVYYPAEDGCTTDPVVVGAVIRL